MVERRVTYPGVSPVVAACLSCCWIITFAVSFTISPHYTSRRNGNLQVLSWESSNFVERLALKSSSSTSTSLTPDRRRRRRIRLDNDQDAMLLSRPIPISENMTITIWEWEQPAEMVEAYWEAQQANLLLGATPTKNLEEPLLDPFGIVSWPGALVASRELLRRHKDAVENKTILILGAGVGMEAMAAAKLGARRVIATDIHPSTLKQIEVGATEAGLEDVIEIQEFDLFSKEPLPSISNIELIVVSDVLYNDNLASQVSKRLVEALASNPSSQMKILVTDSQRFALNFEAELNEGLKSLSLPPVCWNDYILEQFTGSGVSINEDQTYDVTTRILWIQSSS